ncbi:MAG: hypothetical protein GEV06_18650 [Luteitalea sp.]|nr:hypothetical protein [Luteitalea sp.]
MKLTDALLGEHGVIYALFDHVERELPATSTLEDVQRVTRVLAAALVSHAQIEDEMLFPPLETYLGPAGPLAVMRHEHEEIERAIEEVANARFFDEALERLRYALQVARDHFAKEEQILFHMAQQSIPVQDLEQLGHRWADSRGVAVG